MTLPHVYAPPAVVNNGIVGILSELKTDNENGLDAADESGVIGDVLVAAVAVTGIETAGGNSRRQVAGVRSRKSHGWSSGDGMRGFISPLNRFKKILKTLDFCAQICTKYDT